VLLYTTDDEQSFEFVKEQLSHGSGKTKLDYNACHCYYKNKKYCMCDYCHKIIEVGKIGWKTC
jgi:hypothetical protein